MATVSSISRGLDLPIEGAPEQEVSDSPAVTEVALIGDDYVGMKPTMAVAAGDRVKLGQVVFTDKKTPGVQFTAPAAGVVKAVNRGAKRKFESLVIEIDGEEQEPFESFPDDNLAQLDRRKVCELLVNSGLWTSLRTRPFSKVPALDGVPFAVFVTAVDTSPLAADPAVIVAERPADFIAGLQVLSTLTEGDVHVCRRAGASVPGENETTAQFHAFDGPHPAGLAGTHIHMIAPVSQARMVWTIGYQDVIAIGHLFLTGQLLTERIVSLAGPVVEKPRLVRTRLGASLSQIVEGQLSLAEGQATRVVSGSVLAGRKSCGTGRFPGPLSQSSFRSR